MDLRRLNAVLGDTRKELPRNIRIDMGCTWAIYAVYRLSLQKISFCPLLLYQNLDSLGAVKQKMRRPKLIHALPES
jgi:hypothetical protein